MRQFILVICCAAGTVLVPATAFTQTYPYVTRISYDQRPPPPTEPSIPVAEKPAAVKLEPQTPKPVARQKIVRRPGKGPTGPVTMPSPDVLVMMVRAALAGVNQANFTENYSVLHAMTTPALQARMSATQFGKAFANLRQRNLDLSPALVLPPQFTVTPSVTSQGVLRLAGIFPSRPLQINFSIDYLPVDGFWLIDALSVSAMQTAAPMPAPSAVAPAASTASQLLREPVYSGFWEARFVKKTHFGPRLSFATNPQ